jgi:hypothetical protein
MGRGKLSSDEIAARGQEIYDRKLRDQLEPSNNGRFLVMDIESGEYEIDDDDLTASIRASRKMSDALRYGMRIGFPTSAEGA